MAKTELFFCGKKLLCKSQRRNPIGQDRSRNEEASMLFQRCEQQGHMRYTPPKRNMEADNGYVQDKSPCARTHFQVPG